MGSSASKAARPVAGAAKRQYPTRVPTTTNGPVTRPAVGAETTTTSASHDASSSASYQAQTSTPVQAPASASAAAASAPMGPTVHPPPYASGTRDQTVAADGYDPQLAASLRQLGPVHATPTHSTSSVGPETTPTPTMPMAHDGAHAPTGPSGSGAPIFPSPATNPALLVLEARSRLAHEADAEMERLGKRGFPGKAFVDVMLLRRALALRDDRGWSADKIEQELQLRPGTVRKLGRPGVVADAGGGPESPTGWGLERG